MDLSPVEFGVCYVLSDNATRKISNSIFGFLELGKIANYQLSRMLENV